jgi:hypothetical protein
MGRTLAILLAAGMLAVPAARAQDKDFNLSLHAHDHTTAAQIGLPQYPGSVLAPDKDDDSGAADLGFSLGDFHFKLQVAQYKTTDPAWKVFGFYRTALGKYGQVLECDHGKPVGSLTRTNTGLTCQDSDDDKKDGDKKDGGSGGMSINGHDSSNSRELRVGTPQKMHIVGIVGIVGIDGLDDDKQKDGQTHFALLYLELPKDSDNGTK